MELLEGVVGQHGRSRAVGDLQEEPVTTPDCASGRRDKLPGRLGLLERPALRLVDAVAERGVDDDDDLVAAVFGLIGAHGFVELGEARQRTTLGCDV